MMHDMLQLSRPKCQFVAVKAKFHYATWFGDCAKLVRAEIWPII